MCAVVSPPPHAQDNAAVPQHTVALAQVRLVMQCARLRAEGRGFQALKDDLRCDAAIALLARPELTLIEIGDRLGFSEASTFHRAFKHWTGVSPGEYRQASRPGTFPG